MSQGESEGSSHVTEGGSQLLQVQHCEWVQSATTRTGKAWALYNTHTQYFSLIFLYSYSFHYFIKHSTLNIQCLLISRSTIFKFVKQFMYITGRVNLTGDLKYITYLKKINDSVMNNNPVWLRKPGKNETNSIYPFFNLSRWDVTVP